MELLTLVQEHLEVPEELITQLKEAVAQVNSVDTTQKDLTPTELDIIVSKETNFDLFVKAFQKFFEDKKKQAYEPYKKWLSIEKELKEAITNTSLKPYIKEIANKHLQDNPDLVMSIVKKSTTLATHKEISLDSFGIESKYHKYFKFDQKAFIKDVYKEELETTKLTKKEIKETKEYK